MRILFLTHAFNSLTQRLHVELRRRGHDVAVEFDINDAVTREAVALHRPEIIIAPFLKRAIPEDVWRSHTCIVLHPGVKGDRGPSALDWAILHGETTWGVTALQADAEMDAGDVWATVEFPMRAAKKSSLYRNEVTEAAVRAVLMVLERFADPAFRPEALDPATPGCGGRWRPLLRQADRAIDWSRHDTESILRRIRSADGQPGLLDSFAGGRYYLYNASPEGRLRGEPGTLLARRNGAVCRATVDGAVWFTHLREKSESGYGLKLPAAQVLGEAAARLPEAALSPAEEVDYTTWRDIRYEQRDGVGYLDFDFYNGAMGTEACRRLLDAYEYARQQDTRVIVLRGGADFWSNGMDLNLIEAADSPADESWRNINAMDDLARAVITTTEKLTVSALGGNAGAGGVFLALAADRVVARDGIVLNPHYKSMGNLFGSEYWTYVLPRRVGKDAARRLTENRLPVGTEEAVASGLVDERLARDRYDAAVIEYATALAADPAVGPLLDEKRRLREREEAEKPLEDFRNEELERMRLNFYGFDPSYHVARYNFVHKVPHSRTPFYIATHRL